jgi:hypothetical protein
MTGTGDSRDGFLVTTEFGGSTYQYDLRITEEREWPDDADADAYPGTVELKGRTVDGEPDQGGVTRAVRDALKPFGYEVDQ